MSNADYSNIDWTLSNHAIDRQLNRHPSTVRDQRTRLGTHTKTHHETLKELKQLRIENEELRTLLARQL